MTIVVASRNQHKVHEIRIVLAGLLGDLGATLEALPDDAPEVVEDGDTFAANAIKKAVSACRHTGQWSLADDSGLIVDALDGAPGVHSARFAGVAGADADAANNRLLLERLAEVPEALRQARYVCVMALARPGRPTRTFAGTVAGRMLTAPRGKQGFGYDPLFFYPPFNQTFAEVPLAEKNRVSHRAAALALLAAGLRAERGAEPNALSDSATDGEKKRPARKDMTRP